MIKNRFIWTYKFFLVRVNCVSPGWIDVTTSQWGQVKPAELTPEDHSQHPVRIDTFCCLSLRILKQVGRVGNPKDISNMVMFLCSNEASFINGQNMTVDGGMTKKMIYKEWREREMESVVW